MLSVVHHENLFKRGSLLAPNNSFCLQVLTEDRRRNLIVLALVGIF